MIREQILGWFNNKVTDFMQEGDVKTMIYNQNTGEYYEPSRITTEDHRVTIGTCLESTPQGLVWQWRGGRDIGRQVWTIYRT